MAITLKYRKIAGDGINDRDNADVDVDENTGAITTSAANLSVGLKNVLIECYEDGNELNSVIRPVTFEVVETPAPTTTTTTTTTTLAPTTTTTTAAPVAACGTPNADPTMLVTLTGISNGTSYMGCTWNNGETKEVYSDGYIPSGISVGTPTSGFGQHLWSRINGTVDKLRFTGYSLISPFSIRRDGRLQVQGFGAHLIASRITYTGFTPPTTVFLPQNVNVSTYAPAASSLPLGMPIGSSMRFGSMTTNGGETIAWSEGTGW